MRGRRGDAGSAIVEFVFLAVVIMMPLVYFLVAAASVQHARMSVATAAREAGRAFATGADADDGSLRLGAALRLALGSDVRAADVRFVQAGAPCTGAFVAPQLRPGAVFAVCVTSHVDLPAIPRLLEGRGITVVGRYVVHVDEFRVLPASAGSGGS